MGELSVFLLLAVCLAIAWLVPAVDMQDDQPFSSRVFWTSMFVGLLVALVFTVTRAAWRIMRGR